MPTTVYMFSSSIGWWAKSAGKRSKNMVAAISGHAANGPRPSVVRARGFDTGDAYHTSRASDKSVTDALGDSKAM